MVVELDDYEAANLAAALDAILGYDGAGASPLNVLHSGDWTAQVRAKLPDYVKESRFPGPNVLPARAAERARNSKLR